MHSCFDLDIYVAHLQTERRRAAAAAYLASQAREPTPRLRVHLAAALHRLANSLDTPPAQLALLDARTTHPVQR